MTSRSHDAGLLGGIDPDIVAPPVGRGALGRGLSEFGRALLRLRVAEPACATVQVLARTGSILRVA